MPVRELLPLIITNVDPPAPPLEGLTCKPATLPFKELATFVSLATVRSLPSTTWVEYVSDFFFFSIPNAVTTTPDRSLVSVSITTLITERLLIFIVFDKNPVLETIIFAFPPTKFRLYLPLSSVMVAADVP